MNRGFWETLPRPFTALAPMYDVTDNAFRHMMVKIGKPDVMFTEFVSSDGLAHKDARDKLIARHLQFEENQRPIVAQLFGATPDNFTKSARIIRDLGFDGVDINMGCPDKAVVKSGQGASLINNPSLALEIITATKEGADTLPVSVKTRTGFNTENVEEWIYTLAEARPACITVHGRTKKELSKVPTDWNAIGRGEMLAHNAGVLYCGNGDVSSLDEARQKAEQYDLDGIMVGRGVLTNLSLFAGKEFISYSFQQRIDYLTEHAMVFEKYYNGIKPFNVFKKHIGNYITGSSDAKKMRLTLMKAQNVAELKKLLKKIS